MLKYIHYNFYEYYENGKLKTYSASKQYAANQEKSGIPSSRNIKTVTI